MRCGYGGCTRPAILLAIPESDADDHGSMFEADHGIGACRYHLGALLELAPAAEQWLVSLLSPVA